MQTELLLLGLVISAHLVRWGFEIEDKDYLHNTPLLRKKALSLLAGLVSGTVFVVLLYQSFSIVPADEAARAICEYNAVKEG